MQCRPCLPLLAEKVTTQTLSTCCHPCCCLTLPCSREIKKPALPCVRRVWLDVGVLSVSARVMKQKELSVWMLDTGFVQQLVVRLFTLCSSLQPSEASTASQSLTPLLLLDPCSGKGREQRPSLGNSHCGLLICPQPEPSLKVTSQHQEVLSCTLSQLVNSSKWWVKLWNIKMRFFPPFLITFFFSVQISKKSLFCCLTLQELL